MRVSDIMSSPVVTVGPDVSIKAVAETLLSRDISAVPVLDRDGAIVGIVTETDLVSETVPDPRLQVSREPGPGREMPWVARDIMSKDVVCLPDDADAATAAKVMLERGIKQIPIVAEGRLAGIVSRRDLLRLLARPDDEIFEDLEKLFAEQAGPLGAYDVVVSDGHVTLVGSIEPRTARLAELIVRSVPGIVDVEVIARPHAEHPVP
jgi:CBS domain-containing protein